MWRNLLDGPNALNFVLMAAAYRVESERPPPESMSLSPSSPLLHIKRLPEAGVAELINACFHGALDQAQNLASFLYAETGGSPLYLRSLITTLVRWTSSLPVSSKSMPTDASQGRGGHFTFRFRSFAMAL